MPTHSHAGTGKPLTLTQLLFSQGFGTRRECRELCLQERVTIGGQHFTDPEQPIFVREGDPFSVDDSLWPYHAHAYIALHKPAGYECSQKPGRYPSVYTLLPAPLRTRGVQAAGRLDADTTGLLLLSDDGQFIHRAISGKKHLPKTYLVTTKHAIGLGVPDKLRSGVILDGEPLPVAATNCDVIAENQLRMTITTGKYHQVKRMIAAAGNRVAALHRESVGAFFLPPELPPGQLMWISPEAVFSSSLV